MNFSPHPHRPRPCLHSQPQIPTKSPVFLSSHYPGKAAGQMGPLQRCIKDTSLSSHEQALLSHFSPLLQNKVALKRRNNLRFCSLEQREGPRGPNSEHGAAHSPGTQRRCGGTRANKAQGRSRQQILVAGSRPGSRGPENPEELSNSAHWHHRASLFL